MSIEHTLERIATALEAIASQKTALVPSTPAPTVAETKAEPAPEKKEKKEKAKADPKPEPKAEVAAPAEPVTIEQLRAAGTKVIALGKSGDMKEMLASYQVEKLSALPASAYAEVLTKLQALLG